MKSAEDKLLRVSHRVMWLVIEDHLLALTPHPLGRGAGRRCCLGRFALSRSGPSRSNPFEMNEIKRREWPVEWVFVFVVGRGIIRFLLYRFFTINGQTFFSRPFFSNSWSLVRRNQNFRDQTPDRLRPRL